MNCGRVRKGMCRSRGADVACHAVLSISCTRTYSQGARKVNTATYVHMGGVSNAYLRIRMARARVHGEAAKSSDNVLFIGSQPAGSERRNCVVFIGRQQNV